jgi:hypothetical protein
MNRFSYPLHGIVIVWLLGPAVLAAQEAADSPEFSPDQQLVIAAFNLDVERVKKLLAEGADVNARMGRHPRELFQDKWSSGWPVASSNWTPLLAVANSHREPQPAKLVENTSQAIEAAVEALKKVDPRLIAERDRRRITIAKLLLQAKADVNLHDGYGATALASAVDNRYDDLALRLIDAGADVNTKTGIYIDGSGGITPLHRATDRPHLVKALLAHGADPNTRHDGGITPLHWAVQVPQLESARLLIDAGADVNAKDRQGRTPLDCVRIVDLPLLPTNNPKVARLLREHASRNEQAKQVADLIRKAGGR